MAHYDTLAIMNALQTLEPIVNACETAETAKDLNFSLHEHLMLGVLYTLAIDFTTQYERIFQFKSSIAKEK